MTATPPLVAPIAGERFAALDRLSDLIAPPYDVISPPERAAYAARHAQNIVHVMLPEGNGDERYASAARILEQWRKSGALVRDVEPAVYVLRQEFTTPDGCHHARTGVFGAVAAEPYAPGRVRPHEKTHAGPKADRLALIEATQTMVESIFLLAPDRGGALRKLLSETAGTEPTAKAELGGVAISLWRVSGAKGQAIADAAGKDALYIADGHHRFETAGAYRAKNPKADRTIALIVPLDDPGLVVLPTYRLVRGRKLTESEVTAALKGSFDIEPLESELNAVSLLADKGRNSTAALVALFGGRVLALVLKKGADLSSLPGEAGKLDVARVDALITAPLKKQAGADATVDYTPDPGVLFSEVGEGKVAAGVMLNPTNVRDVLAVADAGEVMPQKSTYFIPKVPSGLLFLPFPAPGAR